jgi:hypothetical protein
MVERIQLPVPARVGEIDVGHQNFLVGHAGGTGRRPALRIDDHAAAEERLSAFGAHAVRGRHEQAVRMRAAHRQQIRHHGQSGRLRGHRHPVGGHAQDVGAACSRHPENFGKPDVIADRARHPAERRVENRHAEIARLKIELLVTPQVQLAIAAQHPLRADHRSGVIERIAIAFSVAGDQRDVELRRERAPCTDGVAVRQRFRQCERLFTRLEHITRVAQLGQYDEARTARMRLFDQIGRMRDIARFCTDFRLHLDAGHGQPAFVTGLH